MVSVKTTTLWALPLASVLYGISLFMSFIGLCVLLRGRRMRQINSGMLAATIALPILSTAELLVNIVRQYEGFVSIGPDLPGGPDQYFSNVSRATLIAKSCLYHMQTLIFDGVVIYRTYVVWARLDVVVLPFLAWCGLLAVCIGTNVSCATASGSARADDPFANPTGRWIAATYSMTFILNFSATGLLAWRIWTISRRTEPFTYRGSSLRPLMRVVLESGALYSLTVLAALVLFLARSNGVYVVLDMISPIISIAFNMIVVRIGLCARAGTWCSEGQSAIQTPWDAFVSERGPRDSTGSGDDGRDSERGEEPSSESPPKRSIAIEVTTTRIVCVDRDGVHMGGDRKGQKYKKDVQSLLELVSPHLQTFFILRVLQDCDIEFELPDLGTFSFPVLQELHVFGDWRDLASRETYGSNAREEPANHALLPRLTHLHLNNPVFQGGVKLSSWAAWAPHIRYLRLSDLHRANGCLNDLERLGDIHVPPVFEHLKALIVEPGPGPPPRMGGRDIMSRRHQHFLTRLSEIHKNATRPWVLRRDSSKPPWVQDHEDAARKAWREWQEGLLCRSWYDDDDRCVGPEGAESSSTTPRLGISSPL
ncbi:hypothetical protein C8Q76DRAFT_795482 [Earliella scabrosa]|nr:hypothetical protein C8Q76DRAFT_795482 [Earliella scabrosa]